VNAVCAAEGSSRPDHRGPAPPADRSPCRVQLRPAPFLRRHHPHPPGAHAKDIGKNANPL
jgi:hypothetical protein